MILAIVLVLLMLFCAVAGILPVMVIAQGVKEPAQQAVSPTVNDNYDDVYHAVRGGAMPPDGIRTAQAAGMRASTPAMYTVSFPKPWAWKIRHRGTRSVQAERSST